MINAVGSTKAREIQNYTVFKSKNISDNKNLQYKADKNENIVDLKGQVLKMDSSKELKLKQSLAPSDEPESIKITIPREWTISSETFESRVNHIKASVEKVNRMNLSHGERMNFLKNEGIRWAEDIRENDPEMFAYWLKMNKDNIINGRNDLASLPSDFTIRDYYYYTKEGFSAEV